MKKLIILCLLLTQATAYAQFKVLAESPAFKDPEGLAQILQMKNGNTLFIRNAPPGSYHLQIYDANHQLKLQQNISPDLGKRGNNGIASIFETRGDITIFLNERSNDTLLLYRLVIDGNTGKVKKEDKIAERKAMTRGQIYASWFKNNPGPDFIIRKDLYSDNYAVASFNSFDPDHNKRAELMLYNADHAEMSRAYYTSTEDKYKYLEFIDMAILNNEKVCMLAYAYHTKPVGDKKNELVLAALDKGAATLTLDELKLSEDRTISHGLARFNPITQKLLLLAYLKPDNIPAQNAILLTIDPATRKIENINGIFPEDADRKNIKLFGSRSRLAPIPQNFFINNDGGFTIVSEEIMNIPHVLSSGEEYYESGTVLGKVTVATFDANGKQTRSYLLPKKHFFFGNKKSPFYAASKPLDVPYHGDLFKSFAYINGKDKMYVLFNDLEENAENVQKGKLATIREPRKCDAYYYTLSGDNVLPARTQVFGKPEKEQDHNLAVFFVSDYDPARDLFITLKREVKDKEKSMKLVWMTP